MVTAAATTTTTTPMQIGELRTFPLPKKFFEGGEVSFSMGADTKLMPGVWVLYRAIGEKAMELASAFGGDPTQQYLKESLLSPYVLDWDAPPADDLAVVSINIEDRSVTIKRIAYTQASFRDLVMEDAPQDWEWTHE